MHETDNFISFCIGASVVHIPIISMPEIDSTLVLTALFLGKTIVGGLISVGINRICKPKSKPHNP
jgi:hypothetical protein